MEPPKSSKACTTPNGSSSCLSLTIAGAQVSTSKLRVRLCAADGKGWSSLQQRVEVFRSRLLLEGEILLKYNALTVRKFVDSEN